MENKYSRKTNKYVKEKINKIGKKNKHEKDERMKINNK